MVDLARQAFSTNNFGLAAEIFERTIKEDGPRSDLYLGLADSFARSGLFTKAFEAYTNAFRLGRVTSEKLKHLVTALIESMNNRDSNSMNCNGQQNPVRCCMFTCALCRGLFNDPVTIKCGHTFCRKCLERNGSKTCKVCGIVHYRLKVANIRTNVVLSSLIHRWFPDCCKAAELKGEGNKFFESRSFERAIQFYSEAISLSDTDHLLLSNRSHAYHCLDQHEKALEDAERVVKMRPDWPKGFFRKGNALYGLGCYEDSVIAYLQCLALDKEVTPAKEYLSKSLHKVLSELPPDDPKMHQRQRACNPTPFQLLVSSNFKISPMETNFTADTLSQLKQIMERTVTVASSFQPTEASASSFPETSPYIKDSDAEKGAVSYTGSPLERHRWNSVPVLEERHLLCSMEENPPKRSRSHSLDLKAIEAETCRKRSRMPSANQQPSPSASSPQKCFKPEAEEKSKAADVREIKSELLCIDDLECSLCYRLFLQPVTTPCGHTFCRECLDRCLDHQTSCPMCKSSLDEYLAERRSTVTEALQAILVTYFNEDHAERQRVHEEEINELSKMGVDTQHEIPVFVCTLGFPYVPCPLHIFEPRYRLMIRQCMEAGTRQFGMCTCFSDNEENFSDYGCMLEVRDVHFFPDGRSLVDTVGGRRFRVVGRGKRDGYNTAKVEFLTDIPIQDDMMPELQVLQQEIYADMKKWLEGLPAVHKSRISQHFGPLPDMDPNPSTNPSGPAWVWWCIAVLPIDTRIQLAMLAMRSLKERLEAMRKVLRHLSNRQSQ